MRDNPVPDNDWWLAKTGLPFLTLVLLFALVAIGCNGNASSNKEGSNPVVQPLVVSTTTLPSAGVGAAYSYTLQASGGKGAYSWSVSSGSLPAWASLGATTGAITGMPDAAATWNFSVKVKDEAGSTSASPLLVLVVNPALAITTSSLPDGAVGVPYAVKLVASYGIPPYTWALSGGELPGWASLDSTTGIIHGTPDAAGTSTFTVEVRDDMLAGGGSDTQELSLRIAEAPSSGSNPALSGPYAFLLQGFDDANGGQFAIAGSFTADGHGNITSGLVDSNGPDGYLPATSFTGTYSVGPDNRGFATFTSAKGESIRLALAVGSPNSSNIFTKASLIEFDDAGGGQRGSGFAYRQEPSAFSLSDLAGPHVFGFAGQSKGTGSRMVLAGAFAADESGNVTNGQVDANVGGIMAGGNFTATISADGHTGSFGRMRATSAGASMPNFVAYVVSSERLLAMSVGPEATAGLVAGEVLRQASTSFSLTSLQGTAVAYSAGLSPMFGLQDSSAGVGVWTFDGGGSASSQVDWTEGWMASWQGWFEPPGPVTGSWLYSVSPNGRVIVTDLQGKLAGIDYLVDANKGFSMSADGESTSGFFEPQTGGPFSNSSLFGNYFFGTVAPAIACSAVVSGTGVSVGDGTLSLTLDRSDPTALLVGGQNVPLNFAMDANGRGEESPSSASVLYAVSPTKIILVTDPSEEDCPRISILEH